MRYPLNPVLCQINIHAYRYRMCKLLSGEVRQHKVIDCRYEATAVNTNCFNRVRFGVLLLSVLTLYGCEDLVIRDPSSLLIPRFQRSEIFGFVAGFGTTFAAVPDLLAMLKRRSSAGMNPRMAGIIGAFQIAWIYYGLLIASRPVILWNMMGVVINFVSVGAYLYFARKERQ
jgi:MtN3 and saliva related transmembrane protein